MYHLRSDFCQQLENKKLPGALHRAFFSLETSRHVHTKTREEIQQEAPQGKQKANPGAGLEGEGPLQLARQ